jgi:hypothetical protein
LGFLGDADERGGCVEKPLKIRVHPRPIPDLAIIVEYWIIQHISAYNFDDIMQNYVAFVLEKSKCPSMTAANL